MRAWRGGVYLLGTLVSAAVTLVTLPVLLIPGLSVRWARRHRDRAARLLERPVPPDAGVRGALLWLPVNVLTGLAFGFPALLIAGNILPAAVATPLWWAFPYAERPRLFIDVPVTGWGTALTLGPLQIVVVVALAYLAFPRAARAHARICLAVQSYPANERLAERVEVLTRTRAEVLDAHGAELRRIERDLHDGTQARLVAIAMRLAVARQALADDPRDEQFVAGLLRDAHEGAEEAMTELREVIRGVYPPILADRGLDGALTALTTRCGVPARLDMADLDRLPAALEAVVYFAVAESLTNITKHSKAKSATVRVTRADGRLTVRITDDGVGGADDARGTGIAGIRRRALALDGAVTVDSPDGGPTTITLELPCA